MKKKKYNVDYNFKSYVIKEDYPRLANLIDKAIYYQRRLEEDGIPIPDNVMNIDTANYWRCLLIEQHPKEYEEAQKINRARYERIRRLQNSITHILTNYSNVTFLTLTFSDKTLKTTSADTRRRYVSRVLKAYNVDYVANIDFGKKNGREHYHAVLGCQFDNNTWVYGHSLCEWVQKDGDFSNKKIPKRYEGLTKEELTEQLQKDNKKRLSKYISKLTNHAIKETCRSSRIICSRKEKKKIDFDAYNDKPFNLERVVDIGLFGDSDWI